MTYQASPFFLPSMLFRSAKPSHLKLRVDEPKILVGQLEWTLNQDSCNPSPSRSMLVG